MDCLIWLQRFKHFVTGLKYFAIISYKIVYVIFILHCYIREAYKKGTYKNSFRVCLIYFFVTKIAIYILHLDIYYLLYIIIYYIFILYILLFYLYIFYL